MRVVVLAHNFFTRQGGKTARGIYLYSDFDIVGILDKTLKVDNAKHIFHSGRNVPVYSHLSQISSDYDALIIGVSPIGGKLPYEWKEEIKLALNNGKDIINGLHQFLSDDDELMSVCRSKIIDIRKPDPSKFRILDGSGRDANTLMISGTDCSCGKMVTALELRNSMRSSGINVGFIATGQTGMLCSPDEWAVIDRMPGDFMAGVLEGMINNIKKKRDIIIVEGQGSLHHPAYSGVTLAILHGSNAKKIIMCHNPKRQEHHDFPGSKIPPLRDIVKLTEEIACPVSGGKVVGFSIIGESMSDKELCSYIKKTEDSFGLPATDVWRFGCKKLIDHILQI